ncbi:hypothetical protein J6590_012857, partial [Homalodisca vitripennis]
MGESNKSRVLGKKKWEVVPTEVSYVEATKIKGVPNISGMRGSVLLAPKQVMIVQEGKQ